MYINSSVNVSIQASAERQKNTWIITMSRQTGHLLLPSQNFPWKIFVLSRISSQKETWTSWLTYGWENSLIVGHSFGWGEKLGSLFLSHLTEAWNALLSQRLGQTIFQLCDLKLFLPEISVCSDYYFVFGLLKDNMTSSTL
jgi:hypothetical protein